MVYSKIDDINDDGYAGGANKRHKYDRRGYVYFPNLICASANSSRPRQKLISLKGSGSHEGAPTQGQDTGEYSLQSL